MYEMYLGGPKCLCVSVQHWNLKPSPPWENPHTYLRSNNLSFLPFVGLTGNDRYMETPFSPGLRLCNAFNFVGRSEQLHTSGERRDYWDAIMEIPASNHR